MGAPCHEPRWRSVGIHFEKLVKYKTATRAVFELDILVSKRLFFRDRLVTAKLIAHSRDELA